MNYTQNQLSAFKDRFSNIRKNQIIVSVPLVGVLLVFLFARSGPILGIPESIYYPVFIFVILAGVVFSLFNWRCPACRRYLGRRSLSPKFCGHCGIPLAERKTT